MRPGPAIVAQFAFEGELLDISRYGEGHINGTYAARFASADGSVRRYILQRINHQVFKQPEELMHNIERVTVHLRQKILAAGGDPQRETLNLIPTIDGSTFYRTAEGDYWRAYVFIEGAQTYQVVGHPDHLYNAGRAFGLFQQLVSDIPPEELYETIPDFHNTPKRFEAFLRSVERDGNNRARSARAEIEFVERRAAETSVLVELLHKGALVQRITHNDTKFDNVMIDDDTGEGICVVDLDTVMPGLPLYDFGDAIRSGANPATEDEPDVTGVCMDLELYERFTRGYLETARGFLTPTEISYLPFSARLMTLECGMRFLADYLDGDVYFDVRRPGHNLDRCRTQFRMVEDMEHKFDEMIRIVDRYR